jgi:hypothetical protein
MGSKLYATEDELKQVAPDAILDATDQYDTLFITLSERLSRWIDNHTERMFYPFIDTRYYSVNRNGSHFLNFDTSEFDDLWIDDLMEITSVSISEDDGSTYTALATGDYIPMHGQDFNSEKSYTLLKVDRNGDLGSWPVGQRSVRVIGTFNFTDDRSNFFEDTLDEVENNPLTAAGTSLTVNDVDGADRRGITPRIAPGNLLRMGTEFVEVASVNATGNTAVIVRGVNGSTATAHAQNIQIDKFMPPEPLKQACIIQATRQYKRGQAYFADAEAQIDLGRVLHVKTIDPEALVFVQAYTKLGVG